MNLPLVRTVRLITTFSLCLLLFSCRSKDKPVEELQPIDPSIQVELVRYDQLLHSLPQDDLIFGFQTLADQYPACSDIYKDQIVGASTDQMLLAELKLITQDSAYQNLYEVVQDQYANLDAIHPMLNQAIENYLKIFQLPETSAPRIFTLITGFTYQSFLFADDQQRTGLGIGLDMFLDEFPYEKVMAKDPRFSEYLTRTYNQDHLVRKMTEVLVEDQMPVPQESNLLSLAIWGGKKLYLMDQILTFVPDTVITEYTSQQLKWCRENEAGMWQFFFDNDLFYETDTRKFAKLVGPSPHSPGMPLEAPGQTANYMGWRIVEAYMRRHPDTSIPKLLSLDAQQLLDLSRYRP